MIRLKQLFLLICCFFSIVSIKGQSRFLDPTFGNGGVLYANLVPTDPYSVGYFNALITLPDNRTFVSFIYNRINYIARLKENGAFDSAFGINGLFSLNSRGGINAMILQPNGKLVGAGGVDRPISGDPAFFAFRLQPNGTIDSSFGDTGYVVVDRPIYYNGSANGVGLMPDGRVVMAGVADDSMAVIRLESNGVLDTLFGRHGIVTAKPLPFAHSIGEAVCVGADGRISVIGEFNSNFMAARFHPDGRLDTSFNHNGMTFTFVGDTWNYCYGGALQGDGKLVAVGSGTFGAEGSNFVLVRYNVDGTLDSSFGDGGIASVDFEGGDDRAAGLSIGADGRITVGGCATAPHNWAFALVRLLPNGRVDSTFGRNGRITTSILDSNDRPSTTAIYSDGRILLGGYASHDANSLKAVLVRYLPVAVGVTEMVNEIGEIALFPNPATDHVSVKKIGAVPTVIANMFIYDWTGRLVMNVGQRQLTEALGGTGEISIEKLDAGIYFVKLSDEQGNRWVQKFVKIE